MRTDHRGQRSDRRSGPIPALVVIILMAVLLAGCLEAKDTEVYDEVHGQVERTWTGGEERHFEFRVMKLLGRSYHDSNANGSDIGSGDRVHLYYNISKDRHYEREVEEGNYLLVKFVHRPGTDPNGTYYVRDLERTSHPYLGDGLVLMAILLIIGYDTWKVGSRALHVMRNPGENFFPPATVPMDCPICGDASSIIVAFPLGFHHIRVEFLCATCDERLLLAKGWGIRKLSKRVPLWKPVAVLVLALLSLPFITFGFFVLLVDIIIPIIKLFFDLIGSAITKDTILLMLFLGIFLFLHLIIWLCARMPKDLVKNLDMEKVKERILEKSSYHPIGYEGDGEEEENEREYEDGEEGDYEDGDDEDGDGEDVDGDDGDEDGDEGEND